MEYNRSEIMRKAWNLIKTYGIDRKTAMKAAWALAKAMNAAEKYAAENELAGYNRVSVNDWVKYGNNRTYISVRYYTNAHNLKREIKMGYIDNLTGAYIAA